MAFERSCNLELFSFCSSLNNSVFSVLCASLGRELAVFTICGGDVWRSNAALSAAAAAAVLANCNVEHAAPVFKFNSLNRSLLGTFCYRHTDIAVLGQYASWHLLWH